MNLENIDIDSLLPQLTNDNLAGIFDDFFPNVPTGKNGTGKKKRNTSKSSTSKSSGRTVSNKNKNR